MGFHLETTTKTRDYLSLLTLSQCMAKRKLPLWGLIFSSRAPSFSPLAPTELRLKSSLQSGRTSSSAPCLSSFEEAAEREREGNTISAQRLPPTPHLNPSPTFERLLIRRRASEKKTKTPFLRPSLTKHFLPLFSNPPPPGRSCRRRRALSACWKIRSLLPSSTSIEEMKMGWKKVALRLLPLKVCLIRHRHLSHSVALPRDLTSARACGSFSAP